MRKNYILKNWVTEKSIPCRTCKVEIGPSEAAQRTPRTLSRHTEPGRKTHSLLSQFNKLSLKLLVSSVKSNIFSGPTIISKSKSNSESNN